MRTLKADRQLLRNREISLNLRDDRSRDHAEKINDDDSGAFHVSFTLTLSSDSGVSKLRRGNISLRDT